MNNVKNNSRVEWCFKMADGTLILPLFCARKALIAEHTKGELTWAEIRKYGHRAVRVLVTEKFNELNASGKR